MQQLIPIILDLTIVIITLFTVYTAFKKGFIYSLVMATGYVLAIIIAINLSSWLANLVYDNIIRQSIIEKIKSAIETNIGDNVNNSITEILNAIPKLFSNLAAEHFGGEQKMADILSGKIGGTTAEISAMITDTIVAPIVISLLKGLFSIIIFFILINLLKPLVKSLKFLKRVPIVGPINSILGGIAGVLQAFIIILLFTFVVKITISLSANSLSIINSELVNDTIILKYFYALEIL